MVEVIGKTVTALKLSEANQWDQLFTDGTTRRQIPFSALIIGMLGENNKMDTVAISSCIFMMDEKSETMADGILDKVSHC